MDIDVEMLKTNQSNVAIGEQLFFSDSVKLKPTNLFSVDEVSRT